MRDGDGDGEAQQGEGGEVCEKHCVWIVDGVSRGWICICAENQF